MENRIRTMMERTRIRRQKYIHRLPPLIFLLNINISFSLSLFFVVYMYFFFFSFSSYSSSKLPSGVSSISHLIFQSASCLFQFCVCSLSLSYSLTLSTSHSLVSPRVLVRVALFKTLKHRASLPLCFSESKVPLRLCLGILDAGVEFLRRHANPSYKFSTR